MSFADQITRDRGQPATVRIGTVVTAVPLVVNVQGTFMEHAGVLGTYLPVVGHVVALLGQSAVSSDGSSWLVLGDIVLADNAALGAVTVASGTDTGAVATTSATFVPLTGAFNVGVGFVAPASGRVLIHWRSQLFAGAGTASRTGFQLRQGSLTVGAGTIIQAALDQIAISTFGDTSSPEFGATVLFAVIPGQLYNVEMQHRRASGVNNTNYVNRQIVVQPAP